jgi:hypothetical protein
MRRLKLMLTCAVAVAAVSLAPAASASAAGPAKRSAYSFAVLANTATSPSGGMMGSPGDRISVTGAGTFNTARRTVQAAGVFAHYTAEGALHCKGTWWATDFTDFVAFGANRSGRVGGVLSIVVTHECADMGMTMTGIPMTVTSTLNAPAGSVQGTTVGEFTEPLGGAVAIWRLG